MTPQQQQASELLAACTLRDQKAFERLYQLYSANLFALAQRILKHEQRAEECIQDAFVKIWEHAGDFNANKGTPYTWMAAIVRYRALDMLRQNNPESNTDDWAPYEHLMVDELTPGDDESKALGRCLDELRSEQRECILLAFYEGLTHAELSERVDKPLGTVKTWIRRGLAQLKTCLEQ